jgi:hypothetical protein
MTLRARVFSFLFGDHSPRRGRPRPRLEPLEGRDCPSVAFQFDYSMDTSGFFNNPQARATLESAGQLFSSQLNDSLAALGPGGGNHWAAGVTDPSTGTTTMLSDLYVPADTILVYAGGHDYGGAQLGAGGPGTSSAVGASGWRNTVAARGQAGALSNPPTDYGPWGGSVAFDTATDWHFGGSAAGLGANQYDFLSVAVHELGHVLGIALAPSWNALVWGGEFHGPAATAAYGSPPPVSPTGWAAGVSSGGAQTAMNVYLSPGQRKLFTPLDWAGLQDVGWQVGAAAAPPGGAVTEAPQTIGAFDSATGTWYLRNANSAGAPDGGQFQYGGPGWVGVVGDWNGTGETGIGGFDPSTGTWYLRNEASAGGPDAGVFRYGGTGWVPVVGDWSGTGRTGIGGFDPSTGTWYLRNEASAGGADAAIFQFGGTGWRPVVGDWGGTGRTGIGLFDPATVTWYLRDSATPGAPDFVPFAYGGSSWVPLAGNWHGPGGSARRADLPATGPLDQPFIDM